MIVLGDFLEHEPLSRMANSLYASGRAGLKLVAYFAARAAVRMHLPNVLSIPVAGLDAAAAQDALFRLQQWTVSDGSEEAFALPLLWIQTLQLCQVASARLVEDLETVERNLRFWEAQMNTGDLSMLISNGPVACFKHVTLALQLRRPGPDDVSATYKLHRKIKLLRDVRSLLARALSSVFHSAGKLRLPSPDPATPRGSRDNGFGSYECVLLDGTRKACLECVQALITSLRALSSGVKEARQSSYRATLQRAALERSDSLDEYARETRALTPTATLDDRKGSESGELVVAERSTADACKLRAMLTKAQEMLGVECGPEGGITTVSSKESHKRSSMVTRLRLWYLQSTLNSPLWDKSHPLHQNQYTPGFEWPTAVMALDAAQVAASRAGPIISLPDWVYMPGPWTRYWHRFCLVGGVSAWGIHFLYKHSSLAGSDDLESWLTSMMDTLKATWQDHVVAPLTSVSNELFYTFRSRPSIVSSEEFENDKASLLRMLREFESDNKKSMGKVASAAAVVPAASGQGQGADGVPYVHEEQITSGMRSVMERVEHELKSPIYNLISGFLARAMLIQVQRLKVDSEAVMLELDQVLKANELSISIMAAVPAIATLWLLISAICRRLMLRAPNLKEEAKPLRMAIARLERYLQRAHHEGRDPTFSPEEAEGMTVYHISKVYREAVVLYRYHDRDSRRSEWPQLNADLLELARISADRPLFRLTVVERMLRTYSLFNQ